MQYDRVVSSYILHTTVLKRTCCVQKCRIEVRFATNTIPLTRRRVQKSRSISLLIFPCDACAPSMMPRLNSIRKMAAVPTEEATCYLTPCISSRTFNSILRGKNHRMSARLSTHLFSSPHSHLLLQQQIHHIYLSPKPCRREPTPFRPHHNDITSTIFASEGLMMQS